MDLNVLAQFSVSALQLLWACCSSAVGTETFWYEFAPCSESAVQIVVRASAPSG